MNNTEPDPVFVAVRDLLDELKGDWDYEEEITLQTKLFADLGFESIDVVALAASIEEYYQQQLPFAEYLADVAQQETPDITVQDVVTFTRKHLRSDLDEWPAAAANRGQSQHDDQSARGYRNHEQARCAHRHRRSDVYAV